MHKLELEYADTISAREINRLLSSFWGRNSPIAQYNDLSIVSYNKAMSITTKHKGLSKKHKELITSQLSGKTISMGIRYRERLVGHSALIVQPWGEIETAGSIINKKYSHMSIVKRINIRKRIILKKLIKLGFKSTSYVILGSKSVSHGYTIFDFPDINTSSWFCNIAPYVFMRKIDSKREENQKILKLAYHENDMIFSCSAQVIGLNTKNPPYISTCTLKQLPQFWKEIFKYTPYKVTRKVDKIESNLYLGDKAHIEVHIIRKIIREEAEYLENLINITKMGKTILIKVPLTSGALGAIDQLCRLSKSSHKNIRIIPIGLSLVGDFWALGFATIEEKKIPHYHHVLSTTSQNEHTSLKKVATLVLKNIILTP